MFRNNVQHLKAVRQWPVLQSHETEVQHFVGRNSLKPLWMKKSISIDFLFAPEEESEGNRIGGEGFD